MSKLAYISDQNLDAAFKRLHNRAQNGLKRAKSKFDRNVIDPFSLIFEMENFDITTPDEWMVFEEKRQAQKTLVQALGDFHQDILGSVEGWKSTGSGGGIDIVSEDRKIVAEIKNKHNTVKGSDRDKVYTRLFNAVSRKHAKYYGYVAYHVAIISKGAKRYDDTFTPSDADTGLQMQANDNIRTIDGVSFYKMVTGRDDALRELFEVLMTDLSSKYSLDEDQKHVINGFFNKAF